MGRVTLGQSENLGVLWNDYTLGDPITIPVGIVQELTIYNG